MNCLITGISGSFGTAFSLYAEQNLNWNIKGYSRDWLKIKELEGKLKHPEKFEFVIGDIRDKDRLTRAMHGVDVVIHCAAIKDIVYCAKNAREAMLTNVIGTQNVIDAAIANNVGRTLLISTDKAVYPINTYGKTKALAESLIVNADPPHEYIKFAVARYGNVIGSNGSVVPVFKKMIADGAKVLPIFHEQMTRYWFPMSDAIQFVLDCLNKMQGREIFVPNMASIRIVDLAKAFDMPYIVTQLREGEKIHEVLKSAEDNNGIEMNSGNNPRFLTIKEIKESIK